MNTDITTQFAFVFPGQGSQSVGMLSGLVDKYPEVVACFDEASEICALDLWDLTVNGPEASLGKTVNTQPAMLAAGIAVWRVWNRNGGGRPLVMAGHSLGEYSALVASGALEFSDAVRLVALRGRLMQDAVPEHAGGMAAILGMADEDVRQLCADCAAGEVLEAVNYNAPGQVVIAGDRTAVERANAVAIERGAKRAILLPVSVPSHCGLMKEAAVTLREALEAVAINLPAIPVLHNYSSARAEDANAIREALYQQLYRPVLWVDTIKQIQSLGCQTIVESGPGKVLAGLGKRIDRKLNCFPVFDETSLDKALAGTQ